MAGPESNPETRQGKVSRGARRALPNLGARGKQLRKVHLNGASDPGASIEDLQAYLGVARLIEGWSRNFRNPRFRLPETKPGEIKFS